MNSALEFHDSDIAAVRQRGDALHVIFDPGYVHRTVGRAGYDAGSGFLQTVEVVFSNARSSETGGECRGEVADGAITTPSATFDNIVPLPLVIDGAISATITFASGGVLKVAGSGVTVTPVGEARYLEET